MHDRVARFALEKSRERARGRRPAAVPSRPTRSRQQSRHIVFLEARQADEQLAGILAAPMIPLPREHRPLNGHGYSRVSSARSIAEPPAEAGRQHAQARALQQIADRCREDEVVSIRFLSSTAINESMPSWVSDSSVSSPSAGVRRTEARCSLSAATMRRARPAGAAAAS